MNSDISQVSSTGSQLPSSSGGTGGDGPGSKSSLKVVLLLTAAIAVTGCLVTAVGALIWFKSRRSDTGQAAPAVSKKADLREITSTGIGPVNLGMTLQAAKDALSGASFERTSDGEGLPLVLVKVGEEELMILLADEEDPQSPIDWSRKIMWIETFDPACSTSGGVHPGMLISDAEKALGKVKRVLDTEIEARQYVEFERQGAEFIIRIDYSGIFAEGSRESTVYQPQGKILSIAVQAPMQPEPPAEPRSGGTGGA